MITPSIEQLLTAARAMIKAAEYCFFITQCRDGHPRARLMQPYEPEKDFTIYFGASPRSRKVREILRQPKTALAFYDQQETAYLTLAGSASVVEDPDLRRTYWRSNWNDLFPGGPESDDYVLIKFIPDGIEMMNYAHHAMPQPYSLHPTRLSRSGTTWAVVVGAETD